MIITSKLAFWAWLTKDKASYKKLAKINMVAAVVMAVQGILILVLSDSAKGIVGITSNYLSNDAVRSATADQDVLLPASQNLFDLHISYVIAAALFVAALSRWVVTSNNRKAYESGLRKKVSKERWIEHGLVSSLVMVTLAILLGARDITTLLFVVALVSTLNIFAYLAELHGAQDKLNNLLWFGKMRTAFLVWLGLAFYLGSALFWGRGLPVYIYFVFASVFVILGGFAANSYLTRKGERQWKDYLWGEKMYVLLTVLLTSALAWQVFFGTLR